MYGQWGDAAYGCSTVAAVRGALDDEHGVVVRFAHADAEDLGLADVTEALEGADEEFGVCQGFRVVPGEVCEAETDLEFA
jgi:hypothetical protein